MEWSRWEPLYEAILEDLGYDRAADEEARDLLRDLLADRSRAGPDDLAELLGGREVHVVGAGPGLASLPAGDLPGPDGDPVVACDPATTRLLEVGRVPDLVVTDLDGDVDDQVQASREGAVVVVHGHGDNRDALRTWVPRFPGPVLGTTQAEPRPPVHNWGGFTDGDRAVLMADAHGARTVRLHAFDLAEPGPGPTGDRGRKARKLAWARRILDAADPPLTGP